APGEGDRDGDDRREQERAGTGGTHEAALRLVVDGNKMPRSRVGGVPPEMNGTRMPATLLATKRVEKPWGRHELYPGFPDPAPGGATIGEVWFQAPHPEQSEMLIKYLFTSEKLSVQDHPSDEEAHKRGLPRGKDECWTILAAEP